MPDSDRTVLYHEVAERIERLIAGGTLRPGERIPSVRRLSAQLAVSVTTVLEAYRRLEDRRLVEARPQSGYYVRLLPEHPPVPARSATTPEPRNLDKGDLVLRLLSEANQPELVPLGAATPSPEFFPIRALGRHLAQVARRRSTESHSYAPFRGHPELRSAVARRMLDAGCQVIPDQLLITSGAQEAVHLALRAVTRPGDAVVVESPTYYALFQLFEAMGLRAIEVATDPQDGICLDDLSSLLRTESVAACVLIPSYGNPLGHCMPESNRAELVRMLAERDIPIIEDDIYAELVFDPPRGRALKSFDVDGRVMYCSSFSKTLAPGYRIGWILPGRYQREIELMKFATSVATASPTQLAVAEFLVSGGFDRHLRRLRRSYQDQMRRMLAAVAEHFPPQTRATRPLGGHLLWIELPSAVDSLELHEAAVRAGLSIAPGALFSADDRYRSFIRLNCAVAWTPRLEAALARLGGLVKSRL